jgi:hypothetical protein
VADQNDKALTAGDAGIKQIALQHRVVLGHDRDHHGGVTQRSAGRGDWRNRMGGDDAKTNYKERAATAECASAQARIACAAWTRSTPSRCGTLSPPTWSCTCRLMPELSYSYGVILSFGPADLLQLSARNPIEVDNPG